MNVKATPHIAPMIILGIMFPPLDDELGLGSGKGSGLGSGMGLRLGSGMGLRLGSGMDPGVEGTVV